MMILESGLICWATRRVEHWLVASALHNLRRILYIFCPV